MVIDVELGALTETSCGGKLGATEEKCDWLFTLTNQHCIYPIHPIGNSLKKQKSCAKV